MTIHVHRRARVAAVAWTAVLLIVSFAGAFGLAPFYDDWTLGGFARSLLRRPLLAALVVPEGLHWSPLLNAAAMVNYAWMGLDRDGLVRALAGALQAGSLLWCAIFLRRIGVSSGAAALAMAILALHHMNAAAIYSFDGYPQMGADLAAWVAVGLTYHALISGSRGFGDRRVVVAALLTSVAMLLKETALTAAVAMVVLSVVAWHLRPPLDWERRRGVIVLGSLVAFTLVFALVRWAAGARLDAGPAQSLCFSCIPRNVVTIGGALVLPVRAMIVLDAWQSVPADWAVLAIVAAGASAVVAFISIGLWWRGRRSGMAWPTALLAAMPVLACLPVAALGDVSELRGHTTLLWFAVVAGVATHEWLARVTAVPFRWAGVAVIAIYVLGLGAGLRANLRDMRESGVRAAQWHRRYEDVLGRLPPDSTVLLREVWPLPPASDYMSYRLTSPEWLVGLFGFAQHELHDDSPRVVLAWRDQSLDRFEEPRRAGRLYELRRRGESLTISPIAPSQ